MNTMPDLQEREARNWAMLCHVSALLLFLGVPFGNVFGPLVVWMIKGKQSQLVDDQGREAVNFGITMTILYAMLLVFAVFLVGIPVVLAILNKGVAAALAFLASAWMSVLVFPLVHFLLIVVGAICAANGEYHRYPFTIRFIR
jgi:uncharacterized protein